MVLSVKLVLHLQIEFLFISFSLYATCIAVQIQCFVPAIVHIVRALDGSNGSPLE